MENQENKEKAKEKTKEEIKEEIRKKCEESCQFHSSICTNHTAVRNREECIELKMLNEDVGPIFGANIVITECDLIRMRSEIPLDPDGFICAAHQFKLGKGYRPSSMCKYRQHPTGSTSKGYKISWPMYTFVESLHADFVLGSLICKPCQRKLRNEMPDFSIACEDDDNDGDPDFVPAEPFVDDQEKQTRREELDSLASTLGVERVSWQLTSNMEDVEPTSLQYFELVPALHRSHT